MIDELWFDLVCNSNLDSNSISFSFDVWGSKKESKARIRSPRLRHRGDNGRHRLTDWHYFIFFANSTIDNHVGIGNFILYDSAFSQCNRNLKRGSIPSKRSVKIHILQSRLHLHLISISIILFSLSPSPVGWSSSSAQYDHGFGSQSTVPGQDPGIKARLINLISAVRVLLRCE